MYLQSDKKYRKFFGIAIACRVILGLGNQIKWFPSISAVVETLSHHWITVS